MEDRVLLFDENTEILTVKSSIIEQLKKQEILNIWASLMEQKANMLNKLDQINMTKVKIPETKETEKLKQFKEMLMTVQKSIQMENLNTQETSIKADLERIEKQIAELEPIVKQLR